jgi:hypothetical protein
MISLQKDVLLESHLKTKASLLNAQVQNIAIPDMNISILLRYFVVYKAFQEHQNHYARMTICLEQVNGS